MTRLVRWLICSMGKASNLKRIRLLFLPSIIFIAGCYVAWSAYDIQVIPPNSIESESKDYSYRRAFDRALLEYVNQLELENPVAAASYYSRNGGDLSSLRLVQQLKQNLFYKLDKYKNPHKISTEDFSIFETPEFHQGEWREVPQFVMARCGWLWMPYTSEFTNYAQQKDCQVIPFDSTNELYVRASGYHKEVQKNIERHAKKQIDNARLWGSVYLLITLVLASGSLYLLRRRYRE